MVIDPEEIGLDVSEIVADEARCFCPFHDDHRPSASFNIISGLFNCFGCGVGMKKEELAKELNGNIVLLKGIDKHIRGEWWDDDFNYSAFSVLPRAGGPKLTKNVREASGYLGNRMVSLALAREMDIRAADNGVAFLIKNGIQTVVGAQIRQYEREPKYLFYGRRMPVWPFWKLTDIRREKVIYLTEGVFGALRARTAGLDAFATMGASALRDAVKALEGRPVIGVFDPDYAGAMAMAKLISVGIPIAFPMYLADETSVTEWQYFDHHPQTISVLSTFLEKLPTSWVATVLQHAERFQKNIKGE